MPAESYTLTARWIFPVFGPPLPRGTITIRGDTIEAVEPHGTRTADVDLGNVAILPGFVNAHTHLDLSDALGKCPPTPDFTQWLRLVIAHRRQQTPDDVQRAIDIGLSQCLRYGTTLVGDISTGGASWDQVSRARLRAVVFYEMIGLTEERAQEAQKLSSSWQRERPWTKKCHHGLSPHAPYSVRKSVFQDLAIKDDLDAWGPSINLAVHLAESTEELQLVHERKGPFVRFLEELGAWDPTGLVTSYDEILKNLDGQGALFIHCNYLPPEKKLPGYLIYCPRTHAAFGHPPHPFREYLANRTTAGSIVALGTDSLASNPDLDILAEMRFIHQLHPDFSGSLLLALGTLYGAAAVGFFHLTGSLTAKKSADLVVLPLTDDNPSDPHQLIFESSLPIKAVIFRGRLTYSTDMSLSLPGPL